jgi:coniferyl-aldehyde dehydrogenase
MTRWDEVIAYIAHRPTPLAAYWYGKDNEVFHDFLRPQQRRRDGQRRAGVRCCRRAVRRQRQFQLEARIMAKAGFDTFTHRRTVASRTNEQGIANALVDGSALTPEALLGIDAAIQNGISRFEKQMS